MDFIEQSAPESCAEFPTIEAPGEGTLFRGVRIYCNGRWATADEVAEMLAEGETEAVRLRQQGVFPHHPH